MLATELDESLQLTAATPVLGGDINAAFELRCGPQRFFVKLNSPDKIAMFEQEARMLGQLDAVGSLRVPQVRFYGAVASHAFIVMEFLTLDAIDEQAAPQLGAGLAQLHRTTAPSYGWPIDGYIGLSRQPNAESANWCEFWQSQRLGFQQRMAIRNGLPAYIGARLELLTDSLAAILGDYQPPAALLHGDLWHGNCGVDESGEVALFDPACYYGDAEADLALTELFGGFPESFYQSYWQIHPRAAEYEVRSQLYQLYHVLNHFNLFGGLYGNRAGTMVELLLAEIGH